MPRNYNSRSVTTGLLEKNPFTSQGHNEWWVLLTASSGLHIMTYRFCPLKTNEMKKIVLHRSRVPGFLSHKCYNNEAFFSLLFLSLSSTSEPAYSVC